MNQRLTIESSMKEIVSTLTSKGQVTIPAEVRRYLGVGQGDKLSFVIADDGTIALKAPKYPTVASLRGRVASLPTEMSYREMKEIAHEDRLGETNSDEV